MDDLISSFENIEISTPIKTKKCIKIKRHTNHLINIPETINIPEEPEPETISIKNGKKPSENGKKYEIDIVNIVKYTYINNEKFNTQKEGDLGGSSSKIDIICNFNEKINNIGIEAKNSVSAEYIQLDVHKEDDKWIGPKITRNSHPESVINRYLDEINAQENLYFGKMPPLNKTKKEFEEWETWLLSKKKEIGEKENIDYSWKSKDNDFVKKNYKDKGCSYIQIKDFGLYHLGNDICNFNVPEFKPDNIRLRIRCKRRGSKGCVPSSITMSAYVCGLKKSEFSLDDKTKLPKNLIYKE